MLREVAHDRLMGVHARAVPIRRESSERRTRRRPSRRREDLETMKLRIPDDATRYLNPQGLQQFETVLENYGTELLAEAGRLEAAARSTNGDPEITSTLVRDADLHLRRGYRRRSKGSFMFFSQLVGSVGALITGLLFDFELLKDPLLLVGFVISLSATIAATATALVKEQ